MKPFLLGWSCVLLAVVAASAGTPKELGGTRRGAASPTAGANAQRTDRAAGDGFVADRTRCEIRDGRFYQNGKRVFMKVGKPLLDYGNAEQCERLISWLPTYRRKGYTALELNCYWHHFDHDGDGTPDVSLAPLAKAVDAIYAAGMYPCLSVETYAVGGGMIPNGFWAAHPDAYARDATNAKVKDEEYGMHTSIVSIYNPDYRKASRTYIRKLAEGIDCRKLLWFETTVEPQYYTVRPIDYGPDARRAYAAWRGKNGVTDAPMPDFPIPDGFVRNPTWNRFRAEALADWINGDAAAFRSVAGRDAWVAVDFLYAQEPVQYLRDGDPVTFLRKLDCANVLQVNWHWNLDTRKPNDRAYAAIRQVQREIPTRRWAITEHMTFNGDCFVGYSDRELREILEATLRNGSGFGWEFVTVTPGSGAAFCLYEDDFRPKRVMAAVDDHWDEWLARIYAQP